VIIFQIKWRLEVKKLVKTKKKKTKPGIDQGEWARLITYTFIYLIFIAIIGGVIESSIPDMVYIGTLPLQIQEVFWALSFMIWAMVLVKLNIKYQFN